jgi:hypothetical protein
MSIFSAALLFSLIILLYWIITELFTIFFRFTGLPEEKARFQVISLLTGCGFTTRESEMIISSRSRRRLARITILFGYVFNITIVSTLVNLFISVKTSLAEGVLGGLLIPLAALTIIFIFMRVPAVRAFFDRRMEKLAGRFLRGKQTNSVQIMDYIGRSSIVQVTLHTIPEAFAGIPLSQTGLRSEHGILVMLIEADGKEAVPAAADTVFQPGDKLTVFGDYRTICRIFDARERFTDEG